MANRFVLADGCEPILEENGITVFLDEGGVERAVFNIDTNEDPLPHCDPNSFGYAIIMVNFKDLNEGIAICEVVELESLIQRSAEAFGAQVIQNL